MIENSLSTISPEAPLILALDIGTSSVQARLFDRLGRAVRDVLSQRTLQIEMDLSGAFEFNADTLLEEVFACIDEVVAQVGPLAEAIGGVSCCTFASSVLGLDWRGRAITPLVLYGDTRAAPQAAQLSKTLDEAYFHQRTGTRFHSSYLPARFLWWRQTQPDIFSSVRRWVSLGEYLLWNLFGEMAVSLSIASWSGLLNRVRLEWDDELLARLPLKPGQLSGLVDTTHAWRGLRGPFAARWPALAQTPWFPAIGDGAAANLGSGCASPDRVAISIGTSSAVRVVIPGAKILLPSGLWCYRVDSRRGLLGGALTEGGSVFAWSQKLFNLSSVSDIEAALAAESPGAHGLTFLPLISGERSPGWVSEARGVMVGLSIATTPLDILRAGLEGVACRVALVYKLLRGALPADARIIASGGAIQSSPVWQQILADALGQLLYISDEEETSTRGAALLALEALDQVRDLARLPERPAELVRPNPENYAIYQEMIARQTEIYQALIAPF